MFCAKMRVVISPAPPGGNGRIILRGLDGKLLACAALANPRTDVINSVKIIFMLIAIPFIIFRMKNLNSPRSP
jgi:hypothetical protein